MQGKIWSKRGHLKTISWRTVQPGSRGMPVSVSSSSRQLCSQHNKNLPSNSLCDRNLSVTACPLGAGDPEAKAAPCLQPDRCGPCSVPGHPGPLLCHAHSCWRQESPRMRSSDACGQCWGLSGFLPISLGMFYWQNKDKVGSWCQKKKKFR